MKPGPYSQPVGWESDVTTSAVSIIQTLVWERWSRQGHEPMAYILARTLESAEELWKVMEWLATREPLHDSYIHETGRVSPSFFVFHDLGLVFKSTGQLFWRMFFHLGSSGVSSWLGSGHAFQARRPQKSCGVISLCLIKRYMVPAVLFLELLTLLVKMISATFLSVKLFHPICN